MKEEHFQPVAEALLWTLEQGLGDAWDDEVKAAWTEAYVLLSTTMIDAMKAAQPAAAPKPTGFWAKLKSFFSPAPA